MTTRFFPPDWVLYRPRRVEIYCQRLFTRSRGRPLGCPCAIQTGVDVKDALSQTTRPPGIRRSLLDRHNSDGHHRQSWVHRQRLLASQLGASAYPPQAFAASGPITALYLNFSGESVPPRSCYLKTPFVRAFICQGLMPPAIICLA